MTLKRHGWPERIIIDGSQTNREAILSCDTVDRLQERSRRDLKPFASGKAPTSTIGSNAPHAGMARSGTYLSELPSFNPSNEASSRKFRYQDLRQRSDKSSLHGERRTTTPRTEQSPSSRVAMREEILVHRWHGCSLRSDRRPAMVCPRGPNTRRHPGSTP